MDFFGQSNKRPQNLPYFESPNPTLEECGDAAGSIHNPLTPLTPVAPYTPPDMCMGEFTLSQGECGETELAYQESNAAEVLNISGAPVNIFKLLGTHEQGKLVNVTGEGTPLGFPDTSCIFDVDAPHWLSLQRGLQVVADPAYIGYDFGVKKTSFGQVTVGSGVGVLMNIGSFKIKQPVAGCRALQVRVDSSNGGFYANPHKFVAGATNVGDGFIMNFSEGVESELGTFIIFAVSPEQFCVTFQGNKKTQILGIANVGKRFTSLKGSFDIVAGVIPFAENDSFSIPVELNWRRVDVVNLPNVDAAVTIQVKQSAPARYWRIVPVIFQGVTNPDAPWVVDTLEIFDVGTASLDVVQDLVFMENRDRDYAHSAIQLKAAYTPFDAVSDLSKFGFQISDIYTFTTSFATMVTLLGRPIVVGDVLELPSELQYDHNLKPVRKFLEVTDTGWAADGFTTGWKPIIFKFQAQQLIPGQEHRDLFGDVGTQKFITSDDDFFAGLNEHIQTQPLLATEVNAAEALDTVPMTGVNNREFASGRAMKGEPGSYDGRDFRVEDGLPPDGQPYTTGMKLPDVGKAKDRDFFRLEYDAKLNIPARLYQFSAIKNDWIHIETDRRSQRSSHNKNQRKMFESIEKVSMTATSI